MAPIIEVSVFFHEIEVLEYHIPYLLHAIAVEARIGKHLALPPALWHREEMKGITETLCGKLAALHIIAITLVDYYGITYLHYAALDALQFIASARHLQQEKEIDHGVTSRLALSYSHCLYKYLIIACRLAQHYRFTSLACHAPQTSC